MKNIFFRDGILIYYGNPAGYLSEGKVVLDSIFDKEEIIVFRGDADKASEFIKAQDQVLDEIKAAEEEALQEEGATEEDGQPVMNADSQETTEEEETTTDGEE